MIVRYFLEIITLMFIVYSMFGMAYAQNATPNQVAPTVSQAPVDTNPTPNFQYLPQKAYVQPYKPEVGVPSNAIPLTGVPQVIQQPVQPVQNNGNILDQFGGTAGVLAMLASAGVYIKTRLIDKKTEKVEDLTKENIAATVRTKEQLIDNTKYTFAMDPEKANAINDLPSIQLQTMEQEKKDLSDKAAKA